MVTTITRRSDSATLPLGGSTGLTLLSIPGIHDFNRTRSFTSGPFGESIPLSQPIAQKQFSIGLIVTDITGATQLETLRFFANSSTFYTIQSPEHGIPDPVEFTVIEANATDIHETNIIDVTCQARFGDWVETTKHLIQQFTLAPGATFTAWSQLVINSWTHNVSIELELLAPVSTNWAPTDIVLGSIGSDVVAQIGIEQGNGSLTTAIGRAFTIDSFRELVGDVAGRMDTRRTKYFRVPRPGSVTLSVPAFVNPTSQTLLVTVSSVSVAQKLTV